MENEVLEPEFDSWTSEELFYHLIDLHQIPYEEEFESWRMLKAEMIQMCKESYKRYDTGKN